MLYSQESKYDAVAGQLVNRATREPIPNDEPVFVLRAKDLHALTAIRAYIAVLESPEHREAVARRAEQFEQFAQQHPERMKTPDTAATQEQQGTAETTNVVAEICTDEKGNVLWVEPYVYKRKEAVGATFTRDRKTYQVLHSAVTFGKHRGALVEHVVRQI